MGKGFFFAKKKLVANQLVCIAKLVKDIIPNGGSSKKNNGSEILVEILTYSCVKYIYIYTHETT